MELPETFQDVLGTESMRVEIEYQDRFGSWKHFQSKHNEADVMRVASRRAQGTGKRHRLLSADGSLLDLLEP